MKHLFANVPIMWCCTERYQNIFYIIVMINIFISRLHFDTLLTHWGRVTHICVNKLTIIGSDNGLSPGQRQAIVWTNAGILLIGPLWTNFSEILIAIHTFSFKKMHLKMSSGKWRPFCLGLNVLKHISVLFPEVFSSLLLPLQWCHLSISNHQLNCFLNSLSKEIPQSSKLLSFCEGNTSVTIGFPSQRASNGESVSILWGHHDFFIFFPETYSSFTGR